MPNKLLNNQEYQKIYQELNDDKSLTTYTPYGMIFMRCNGELLTSRKKLVEYKKREKKGERFIYEVGGLPYGHFYVVATDGGFVSCTKDEVRDYLL